MDPNSNSSSTNSPQPVDPQQPQSAPSVPVAPPSAALPQQSPAGPPAMGSSVDNKVFSGLRYWLILFGVSAVGEICGSFAPLRPALLAIWAAGLVLSYKAISKMKAEGVDELKQSDKDMMVFYMAIDTIFAQLFYYFRLKKTLPKIAKLAFSIGWKVLVLQLIFVIIFGVVLGLIFH